MHIKNVGLLTLFHLYQAACVRPRDALLLKQMPKKQTGFVLLQKQNKSDLVSHHQN